MARYEVSRTRLITFCAVSCGFTTMALSRAMQVNNCPGKVTRTRTICGPPAKVQPGLVVPGGTSPSLAGGGRRSEVTGVEYATIVDVRAVGVAGDGVPAPRLLLREG